MAEELRFIHITAAAGTGGQGQVIAHVFGLTSDGRVYQRDLNNRGWQAVSMIDISPPRAERSEEPPA